MAHPFFTGIDWDLIRGQKMPVPAYDIVRDQNDPAKVISFSLSPPEEPEDY